jgi:hypothetical protein
MSTQRPSYAELERLIEELKRTNAELRARDAGPQWLALKACNFAPFTYEAARLWCEDGSVDAKKEGGRWFVRVASLKEFLAHKGVHQQRA